MKLNKKGFVNMKSNIITAAVVGLVLIAILMELSAVLIPQVQTSSGTLCATGIPLAGLFTTGGVIILVLVASLVLVIVGAVLGKR